MSLMFNYALHRLYNGDYETILARECLQYMIS